MSYVALGSAAIGAAGSIGGALLSDSGGGGGGGPDFEDLTQLFGNTNSQFVSLLENLLGGGGESQVLDFLQNPVPLTFGEKDSASFFFPRNKRQRRAFNARGGSQFDILVNEADGLIRDELFPVGREVLEDGLRTDLQPIIDAELRRFNTETIPGVAERFAGSLDSSGFQQSTADAASDLGIFLGANQVGLDEAASGRRLNFLQSGAAQNLFTAPLNLRSNAAILKGTQGELFRNREESTRAGGRILGALPTLLSGLQGTSGFLQSGFPTGAGGGSATGAALAQILPGLIGAGSNLFGAQPTSVGAQPSLIAPQPAVVQPNTINAQSVTSLANPVAAAPVASQGFTFNSP